MPSAVVHGVHSTEHPAQSTSRWWIAWLWFALKNVLGLTFLALAVVLGPLPGPGGIFLFIIGFALIWFPGKRRLTTRVLRGIPIPIQSLRVQFWAMFCAMMATPIALWWLVWREHGWLRSFDQEHAAHRVVVATTALLVWLLIQCLLQCANLILRVMPRIRRKVRPWLRERGIELLPPRLRWRVLHDDGNQRWHVHETGDIVEVHERHWRRLRHAGRTTWGWCVGAVCWPWRRRKSTAPPEKTNQRTP